MAEIVNLRLARKAKRRAAADDTANANRAKFGSTKTERTVVDMDAVRLTRTLDGAALDRSVRPALLEDIPAMHAIRLAVCENALSATSEIMTASYQPYVDDGTAWVALRGSTIIGFAIANEATASVWALFVAPTAERTGVGRALQAALLAWASDCNLAQLSLTTAAGTRAARFYEQSGWQAVDHDEHGQIRFVRSLLA